MNSLAQQIQTRIRAKNISVEELEKRAHLKRHSVRNILRGMSRKPNAEILLAICQILDCHITELLEESTVAHHKNHHGDGDGKNNERVYDPELCQTIIDVTNKLLREQHKTITIKQWLTLIEEVYINSSQYQPYKVNAEFVAWFISLL